MVPCSIQMVWAAIHWCMCMVHVRHAVCMEARSMVASCCVDTHAAIPLASRIARVVHAACCTGDPCTTPMQSPLLPHPGRVVRAQRRSIILAPRRLLTVHHDLLLLQRGLASNLPLVSPWLSTPAGLTARSSGCSERSCCYTMAAIAQLRLWYRGMMVRWCVTLQGDSNLDVS